MVKPEFETSINMKTIGIILKLSRAPWNTRKAVIMDSGFRVQKGTFKMKTRGVYGSALIKKRLYWPREGFTEK